MLVRNFLEDFRLLVGDTTFDAPDEFLIAGLNWALRELPLVPRLARLFAHHYTVNLDAKDHYKWDLTAKDLVGGDEKPFFDRVMDMDYIKFWDTRGGQPCPMKICNVTPAELYSSCLPQVSAPGVPSKYALEREADNLFIVFDKRSNIPIIVDYIAYGIPAKVTSLDDDVPISKLCENAILAILRSKFYEEADDLAFSGQLVDYMSNVYYPQLVQEIHKKMRCEANYIMGR